jgi:hypothetical protein
MAYKATLTCVSSVCLVENGKPYSYEHTLVAPSPSTSDFPSKIKVVVTDPPDDYLSPKVGEHYTLALTKVYAPREKPETTNNHVTMDLSRGLSVTSIEQAPTFTEPVPKAQKLLAHEYGLETPPDGAGCDERCWQND